MENQKIEISIVIPVYNEEENIKELFLKLERVLNGLNKTYEIIFIDDGSTDKTFDILKDLSKEDEKLKVIQFRRNFGKSVALTAGFEHVKGDFTITMDGDLQDDPEEIPNFLEKIKEGYDLIVGWKYERKDPIGKKIFSKIFNKLTAWLTGVKIHDSNCCFKVFRKEVVKNIKLHGELHRYIPALSYWQGYKVAEIKVKHYPRKHGKSKYGLMRLLKGFLDLITVKFLMTYLTRPIHFFGQAGLILLFFGFLSGGATLIFKFILRISLANTQLPLITVFLIIVGVQFILMGILAEILIRIYYEPRGKSPYSIKEKINFQPSEKNDPTS
ncbi:MAG: glycosyltransferase family 2 protein [Candidatus Nealsonbacteria bacterium]|nr:glycosyltransferase family 2 protein [Candidatus Nealsonbacteria bacterium]